MSHWKESDAASKDRAQLQRALAKKVKQTGDIEIPMDADFYDRLHDKIMAAVEETDIKPVTKLEKTQRVFKRHWRSVSQVTLAILILVGVNLVTGQFVGQIWTESHTVKFVQNEKQIVSQAVASPEEFSATVLSSQNQNDFILDVASQNLEQISPAQLVSMINEAQN